MKNKSLIKSILPLVFLSLVAGCLTPVADSSASCIERDVALCEDFEDLSGDLGASQFLNTSLYSNWWVTGDDDQSYLYPDFPVDGRSRDNMILLGDGGYEDQENSLLYTAEIDLVNVESATLSYNLIYRTEEHWDGLVIFAIMGGRNGFQDAENWLVLSPVNGYPDTVLINGIILPGYSGVTTIWREEIIDLAPVLGGKVILAFYFSSDDYLADWGAALDDININTVGTLVTDPISPALNLTELDLKLDRENFIPSKIPRANVVADTVCEGTTELLLNGQRPYIKALNDPGDRALVLHPVSGLFCWVNQEDIWIDGDVRGLARISDLKPEDLFLPICATSFTPVLTTPGCSLSASGSDFDQDFQRYQIQTALIEEGLVTAIVLGPIVGGNPDEEIFDPRISQPGELYSNSLFEPPGGLLWVEVEGSDKSCLLDQKQPGRVVCEGLSLNAGGSVQLNMCWQGFDESQSCPWGFGKNVDGICMPVPDCFPECPAGYQYNDIAGACVLELDPEKIVVNPTLCPVGLSVLSEASCCGGVEFQPAAICPAGFYYSTDQASCKLQPPDGSCPEGYKLDPEQDNCIPANLTTGIKCTSIEQIFPTFRVTVRESTRCYVDPTNRNEIVGSLKPFTIVDVLGLDEDGDTLMVKNPDYEVPCWAALGDFYTDKLDLSILPIIKPQ